MPDTDTQSMVIAREIGPDLIELRRRLHRAPELGLHLPETQATVLEALSDLDLEVHTGSSLSSVVAVLRGGAPHEGERPVVLLRGDMDALPVTEEVDVDYASQRPGLMHACGHDLHVAGLVADDPRGPVGGGGKTRGRGVRRARLLSRPPQGSVVRSSRDADGRGR